MKIVNRKSTLMYAPGLLLASLLVPPLAEATARDGYEDRPRYEQQEQRPGRDQRSNRRQENLVRMRNTLNVMQEFFGIIDSLYEIASEPEKAAIYQMHEIQEIYKARGEGDKLVDMLEDVLKQTTNQTIRNVAYVKLSEALKKTGRSQRAVEVLQDALSENIKKAK